MGIPGTCWCRRLKRHRLILGLGISPKEGNGKLLQYSCLENPMDRGAWWAMGCRIAEQDSTESDLALSSVQLLHLVWQHPRFPCPSPTPRACSNSCSSSQWCHPTISSSVFAFSSSAFNLSQHQGLFQWVSSFHQVAKVLQFQLQHLSFQWIFRIDFI